ncbi:MAG: hypothetical protein AAGA58_14960 [Verrucomicrobiota bacterium]
MQGPSLPQDSDADDDFELDLDFSEDEPEETTAAPASPAEPEVEKASEELSVGFGTLAKKDEPVLDSPQKPEPEFVPKDQPPPEDLAVIFDEEDPVEEEENEQVSGMDLPPLLGEKPKAEPEDKIAEIDDADILRKLVGGEGDNKKPDRPQKEESGEDLKESLTGLGASVGAAVTTLRKERKVIIEDEEESDRELSKEIESIEDIRVDEDFEDAAIGEPLSDSDVARLAGKSGGRKGLLVVLGLIFAAFAGYLAYNAWQESSGSDLAKTEPSGASDQPLIKPEENPESTVPPAEQPSGYKAAMESEKEALTPPTVTSQNDRIPQEAASELRAAIEAYFSVENYIDILEYCRDPERVAPLLKDYYEIHGWMPREVRGVEWADENVIDGHLFWLLEVQLDRFENVLVLVEVVDERYLIDWETQVYYNPVDWNVFVEQQPQGRFDMRVLATLHSEYKYPFTDDSKYLCVKLGSLRSETQDVFGYAERGSAAAKAIVDVLTGEYTNESEYPLILTLEFPEGADGGDPLVHIRDFVAEHWIIVEEK